MKRDISKKTLDIEANYQRPPIYISPPTPNCCITCLYRSNLGIWCAQSQIQADVPYRTYCEYYKERK